jgi:membrane protease YdiL (CAAX protease family)
MSGLKTEQKTSPRGFGGPIWVIATTVLIFIISQIIAALVVEAGFLLTHPGSDAGDALNGSAPVEFFYVLAAETLAIGLVWLTLKGRKLNWAAIGLGRKPKLKDLGKGIIGFVAFYAVLIVITVVMTALIPGLDTDQKQQLGFNNPTTSIDEVLTFAGLVMLPPIAEEILVRGYLYSGLRSRWKFVPAMIVTSIIFGLAHLQFGNDAPLLWAAALDTFVLSLVLVYMREKTGALYASILIHILNNALAYGVHFR